ncbi:unnamed protein product [Clonostachys byssicola]|uniref:Uncharacterized protein n=1 Tax=Clonostachys byssicola TaxID=160290 RepID=A0A9N9UUW5_9HYPO|nr:unnamed protein product [Clonostachys byssicola]
MESSAVPQPTASASGKVRILLQTITHLVPGSDRAEKLDFIDNLICQHLWKRNFDNTQERRYFYHDYFGLDNVECYFLIDHHGHDHTVEEEKVPVLWYKWTGESLVHINQELPSQIQRKLRKWPFTWEGKKFHRKKRPDGECELVAHRRLIMSKLILGIPVFDEDIKFLKEHPEHAQWIKDNIKNRQLWVKIEPYCDLPGEPAQ